ncbi:MAG: CHASE2 domain-containing protein [Deltaproteobacteria bacterium]|nr:CHASE2 domain-containing protein [Deltaproteobacteria bacterium]
MTHADRVSEPRRGWRRYAKPLAQYLLFLAGGVVLLRMDPFGLTRLTKYYSQDLLAVAMAGCYPGAPDGPCVKDHHAQTAVVLLRDGDLSAFAEPWPPRYGFHARVLKAIRANKPRAVVIDIVFEDRRDDPSIAALAAELDRYRAAGIPVYAAAFAPDRPLRPEVGERVTTVQVPKQIDPLDRVTRFYNLTTGPPPGLTAAATAFRDLCGGCAGAAGCGADVIRVYWANLPEHSWNDQWLDCRRRPPFPWWIVQDRGSDFRENCPAAPAIPVRILLEPSEEQDATIESILDGSVVFYGAFFHGAADAMHTPLHNDLPAVFLHAAAFDNLVTLGPQALAHSEPTVPWLDVSLPDFVMLVVIGAVFVARRNSPRVESGWQHLLRRVRSRVGRMLLIAFGSQIGMLVLLAGVAAFLACRLGAAEWVLGINFLFAVTWTEVLDVTEKLFEAAEEFEPE